MGRPLLACAAGVSLLGFLASAACGEELSEVSLSDLARKVAAARAAVESDDASLEDQIRFATWALMVAEFAMEPPGLVSTASDLFEEGQETLEAARGELAGDPELEKAFVNRAPLLAARLDAAIVRKERIEAKRELARSEERQRLNELRSIARAFRAGLAAQSEADAWASVGDPLEAEAALDEAWRSLDEIDRTISESRDYYLLQDEPNLEANPDVELLTDLPSAFRSLDVAANVKAVASVRLLSSLENTADGIYKNVEAATILENAIAWANAALDEDANVLGAPMGASADNVFALYARGRATVLAAVLRAWETPFEREVKDDVARSIQQAAADFNRALEKLTGHENSTIYAKLEETLLELQSPEYVKSRIQSLIDSDLMESAVSEARSLAMRQADADSVALYLDTARRAGVPCAELWDWCGLYLDDAHDLKPTSSVSLRIATARIAMEVVAGLLASPDWPQKDGKDRLGTMQVALSGRELTLPPDGVSEGSAAMLAATRSLLTVYAWLASPDLPDRDSLLKAAVDDVKSAEVFLSLAVSEPPADAADGGMLDAREALLHCRLARGFLATALLPDFRDEARLAFAAAFDVAGQLPSSCREHGMMGSPLLTSILRGSGEGASAKLVAEERSTRQSMTRFVEACFAMEFGSSDQAIEQFKAARERSGQGETSAIAADAGMMMQEADGFDVAISLPESMAAFEILGLVSAGNADEALRRTFDLVRKQSDRAENVDVQSPTDFEKLAVDAGSIRSPIVAFAVLEALNARLDSNPLGGDPDRAAVLKALQASRLLAASLLETRYYHERYPHIQEVVVAIGRELDDPTAFSSATDIAEVERGLRRHPASDSLWNLYFLKFDEATPTGEEGRAAAERALAVLDSLRNDPLVPSAALTLTRAALLERLDRDLLAEEEYARAKATADAEGRVIAASREAILMVRNSLHAAVPGMIP
jgi:hypothetical protein